MEGQRTTNEEVVRAYVEAVTRWDFDAMARLRHPGWSAVWPQSGEIVASSAADRKIVESYPGGQAKVVPHRLVGSEDRWAVSPLGGIYRMAGEGENWWAEWEMVYPDGKTWFTITLIELRDGRVWRDTVYWADPFDAPEWRKEFVERLSQL